MKCRLSTMCADRPVRQARANIEDKRVCQKPCSGSSRHVKIIGFQTGSGQAGFAQKGCRSTAVRHAPFHLHSHRLPSAAPVVPTPSGSRRAWLYVSLLSCCRKVGKCWHTASKSTGAPERGKSRESQPCTDLTVPSGRGGLPRSSWPATRRPGSDCLGLCSANCLIGLRPVSITRSRSCWAQASESLPELHIGTSHLLLAYAHDMRRT